MSAYSEAVLVDNPLLYLRLDEPSGAACANSGSLAAAGDGTAVGTYTRGVAAPHANLGVAVDFANAIANGITVPDQAALDLVGDFTYECWVNPDTIPGAGASGLISKGRDTVATDAGYCLRFSSTGRIELLKHDLAFLVTSATSGILVVAGVWQQIAITRVGNLYTLYKNGAPTGDTATVATVINATDKALQIARGVDNAGVFQYALDGKMDEVSVYGAGLSAARILAHYDARLLGGSLGLGPLLVPVLF